MQIGIFNSLTHYIKNMASDIITVSLELLDLFKKHDLSRVQCMFVLKAAEMQIQEEIIRDVLSEAKKGYDTDAGIG